MTCNPQTANTGVGEKLLDISCIGLPSFGQTGNWVPQYYLRTPSRNTHDLTIFKNFGLGGNKKLQFRAGCVQHLQPGLPDLQHRLHRPRPDSADGVQRRT